MEEGHHTEACTTYLFSMLRFANFLFCGCLLTHRKRTIAVPYLGRLSARGVGLVRGRKEHTFFPRNIPYRNVNVILLVLSSDTPQHHFPDISVIRQRIRQFINSSTSSNSVQQNKALANLTCEAGVLLPTLIVTLRGGISRRLRAVVDTGSQRSYILKSVAEAVGLKPVRTEVIVHSLFGGQKSGSCDHQVYRINLSSLDEKYLCNFEVLDQDTICDSLLHVPSQTQGLKHLHEKGIGARLHASLVHRFPEGCESYFWTDSATVLAWIQRGDKWATFVWNRVEEIRQLTRQDQWRHIPGTMNPADLPSRGCSGKKLLFSRWWEGPEWLRGAPDSWNFSDVSFDEAAIVSEKSKSSITFMSTTEEPLAKDWYYRYFSNFEKIVRMIGWMHRFVHNSRARNSEWLVTKRGPLSIDEIVDAELRVMKYIQADSFNGAKDPRISSLGPFEDYNGLLRLKTKIAYRPDSYDFRFPIVLPRNHPVVELIIRRSHEKQCHIGVQGLMAMLRERYWILGGRRTVKTVISRCVTCRRHDTHKIEQPSPPLCIDRVRDAAAFEVTGVDLAGPIFLKENKKAWVCLFTCGVVRAVHLELVTSLSTDEFLFAFRRFVSRRGRPKTVFCDNATNFKVAENAFRHVDWDQVQEYFVSERITWKFIPPTAAWWGGWWERMIGMMKKLLRKVLKRVTVSYQEMETILCDCERVLNSRPLTVISNDASELVAITPAMFIQDVQEAGVPECDVLETVDLNRRLKYRRRLKEELRRRFRSEYLGQLTQRAREKGRTEIRVGDVVLVGSDNVKRLDWPLGKVIALLPGADETTRLVRLQTASGELLRPVQRLYPLLEAQEPAESSSLPPPTAVEVIELSSS